MTHEQIHFRSDDRGGCTLESGGSRKEDGNMRMTYDELCRDIARCFPAECCEIGYRVHRREGGRRARRREGGRMEGGGLAKSNETKYTWKSESVTDLRSLVRLVPCVT